MAFDKAIHGERLPSLARPLGRNGKLLILTTFILAALGICLRSFGLPLVSPPMSHSPSVKEVQKCAIDRLHTNLSFLDDAIPITSGEFLDRRNRLAHALAASDIDAFILEPGYTFQYFGNVSQMDWEPWEPEERPFLMVVLVHRLASGEVTAKTGFLSPHFEEGRVRMLGIPSDEAELDIVVWEEHWNPYETLRRSRLFSKTANSAPRVMVDEEIRDFIVRGLEAAGFETVGLSSDVELVRQIKSPAEVELLRAVNTGTVVALRALQPCLVPGLTENNVRDILNAELLSVGFELFFNIVLFEEHGALPHGGFVTGWKKLAYDTMIVIDVGAHYMGYSSDICRSFLIDPPKEPTWSISGFLANLVASPSPRKHRKDEAAFRSSSFAEKLNVWNVVFEAQTAAAKAFRPDNSAASVDLAARKVIEDAGYGADFTHRLGHGIGIKAHESPYLNKWNTGVFLQPGMAFTNEPGIYLEGKFGVRHEDVYLVRESGEAELLTDRRAQGLYSP